MKAHNETIFYGNNLVGVASVAIITAKAWRINLNNLNSADGFI